jgi:hypothetical protein
MKRLIFSAIVATAMLCAGAASAMEARFFVKPKAPEPAPRIVMMAPTQTAWVNPDTVGTPPWSFLVQNAEPNMDGRRFEQVGSFKSKGDCENERASVAEGANITYVSETCFASN